jgi:UDP-glucuronate 4-epimerase
VVTTHTNRLRPAVVVDATSPPTVLTVLGYVSDLHDVSLLRLSRMMRRFVVTGCAGFIGSHLVDALLERGDDVTGIDAFTDYYPRKLKEANLKRARMEKALLLEEADLAEADLRAVVAASDGVFHLAARPGVLGSWGESFATYVRHNVLATQRVFEAAVSAGKRVVFASSSSIYGNAADFPTREDVQPDPISPYGVTKLTCEHLARAYRELGLDFVVLRYFTGYGPRQRPDMAFMRIIHALLDGTTFSIYGTGEQRRDATYVTDAVTATLAAMERGTNGTFYNVGGGSDASLLEVIEILESLARRRLSARHIESAAGDVTTTAADTNRARNELGWELRMALASGLENQFVWASDLTTRI